MTKTMLIWALSLSVPATVSAYGGYYGLRAGKKAEGRTAFRTAGQPVVRMAASVSVKSPVNGVSAQSSGNFFQSDIIGGGDAIGGGGAGFLPSSFSDRSRGSGAASMGGGSGGSGGGSGFSGAGARSVPGSTGAQQTPAAAGTLGSSSAQQMAGSASATVGRTTPASTALTPPTAGYQASWGPPAGTALGQSMSANGQVASGQPIEQQLLSMTPQQSQSTYGFALSRNRADYQLVGTGDAQGVLRNSTGQIIGNTTPGLAVYVDETTGHMMPANLLEQQAWW